MVENWTVWELYNKSGAIAVATKNKWGSTSNNLLAMFHTLPVIKTSANMSHFPAHMLLTPGFLIPVILETGEAEVCYSPRYNRGNHWGSKRMLFYALCWGRDQTRVEKICSRLSIWSAFLAHSDCWMMFSLQPKCKTKFAKHVWSHRYNYGTNSLRIKDLYKDWL